MDTCCCCQLVSVGKQKNLPDYHKQPKALKSQVAMFRLLFIKKSFLKLLTMRNILKEHSIIAINRFYLRNNNKPTMKTAAVRHSLAVTNPAKLQNALIHEDPK